MDSHNCTFYPPRGYHHLSWTHTTVHSTLPGGTITYHGLTQLCILPSQGVPLLIMDSHNCTLYSPRGYLHLSWTPTTVHSTLPRDTITYHGLTQLYFLPSQGVPLLIMDSHNCTFYTPRGTITYHGFT